MVSSDIPQLKPGDSQMIKVLDEPQISIDCGLKLEGIMQEIEADILEIFRGSLHP